MNKPTILLVDDEPALRFAVRDYLERGGLQVIEAGDLRSARRQVAEGQPDAAILDYVRRRGSTVYHPTSTCRMGSDPKTSVINSDHRTHDVKNLFLCDGSSLVTSGRGQPTMTIEALAFRAADRITKLAKGGEISA